MNKRLLVIGLVILLSMLAVGIVSAHKSDAFHIDSVEVSCEKAKLVGYVPEPAVAEVHFWILGGGDPVIIERPVNQNFVFVQSWSSSEASASYFVEIWVNDVLLSQWGTLDCA